MKHFSVLIFSVCFAFTANAQNTGTIWDEMKTITMEDYELSVPVDWRDFSGEMTHVENYFEASGLVLPFVYEGSPVILVVFVIKEDADDLESFKDKVVSEYRKNTDRVFEEDFEDLVEPVSLHSGPDAYIISTRFFRKSKSLYQNRYDLLTFSEKSNSGYIYGVSIQHGDKDYDIAEELWFYQFANILFGYFHLK